MKTGKPQNPFLLSGYVSKKGHATVKVSALTPKRSDNSFNFFFNSPLTIRQVVIFVAGTRILFAIFVPSNTRHSYECIFFHTLDNRRTDNMRIHCFCSEQKRRHLVETGDEQHTYRDADEEHATLAEWHSRTDEAGGGAEGHLCGGLGRTGLAGCR